MLILSVIMVVSLSSLTGCSTIVQAFKEGFRDGYNDAMKEETEPVTEATIPEVKEAQSVEEVEAAYLDGVVNTSDRMSTVLGNISTYIEDNSEIIGTYEYTEQITTYCEELGTVLSDIRALVPSEKFKDVQADYLSAADMYQTVVDDFPKAVRDLDTDKIYEILDNMTKGEALLNSTAAKMQALPE